MNPERKEVQIFNAALEISSPAERAAYLDQACADDRPLRRKVEALLQACGEANDFFQTAVETPRQPGSRDPVPTTFEAPADSLRLFQRTWENPTPNVAVDRVDFIAGKTDAYPVLYAITVEP